MSGFVGDEVTSRWNQHSRGRTRLLNLDSTRSYPGSLFPEQPEQQRQNRAYQQTGDDGKMETEIAFGIVDVTRQTPQPTLAKARP